MNGRTKAQRRADTRRVHAERERRWRSMFPNGVPRTLLGFDTPCSCRWACGNAANHGTLPIRDQRRIDPIREDAHV